MANTDIDTPNTGDQWRDNMPLTEQVDILAKLLMAEFSEEFGGDNGSEGAIEMVCRIVRRQKTEAGNDEFWRDVFDGCRSMTAMQVRAELHDYHMILSNVGTVYGHITGGMCSKANTDASVVCQLADEHYEKLYRTEIEEAESLREQAEESSGQAHWNSLSDAQKNRAIRSR